MPYTAPEYLLERAAHGIRPMRRMTVSEWADKYRILSGKGSSRPGKWRTSHTPYLREIMDCLSVTSDIREVFLQKARQIGATEAGNNFVGYIIHHAPRPTIFAFPSETMAKRESRQRIGPMIQATDVLRKIIGSARSRDSGNSILNKDFPNGVLALIGANTPNQLRGMPTANIIGDEFAGWKLDVGDEGDPLDILRGATSTFPNAKIFVPSTPTIKGRCPIGNAFLRGDQRRYYVPCPYCGNFDWIQWGNIRYDGNTWHGLVAMPENPLLKCVNPECGALIEERFKTEMLAAGEWRPTAVSISPQVRSYHLSALYSPLGWKKWSECVAGWLESDKNNVARKTWTNIVLGETWEERNEKVDPVGIRARLEPLEPGTAPNGSAVLICTVDVQGGGGGWLAVQVTAYGAGEESWLLHYEELEGDPGLEGPAADLRESVWRRLDSLRACKWQHVVSKREMGITGTFIDLRGHHSEHVLRYARPREHQNVYAIYGEPTIGRGLIGAPTRDERYNALRFPVYVNGTKDLVYSRLQMAPLQPGERAPGYIHLADWVTEEYIEGLTGEQKLKKMDKGRAVWRWTEIRERVEPWDLTGYGLAGLHALEYLTVHSGQPSLLRRLPEIAAAWAAPMEQVPLAAVAGESGAAPASAAALPRPAGLIQRPRSNWATGGMKW